MENRCKPPFFPSFRNTLAIGWRVMLTGLRVLWLDTECLMPSGGRGDFGQRIQKN